MDPQQEQEFIRLIERGKTYANVNNSPGRIRRGLEYYKRAFKIQKSEKLEKRILKLENYLQMLSIDEDSEESGNEGEEMVHMGEGFYLYRGLYEKLYDHQRQGVLFLWKLYRLKKGGILGDDMGLGKTIQVCAFLGGMFDAERIKSVLIVVPVAVIINWIKEFEQWVPGLDVYTFHDQSKRERAGNLKRVQTKGGICITTYGLVATSADVLSVCMGKKFTWDYVILDEGHKIKNPTTKGAQALHQVHAKHRIVLSGTPIMNNLKELWSLYDWTHSGQLLGSAKTFAMEYENHITRAREKDATAGEQRLGVEMSKGLQGLIQPFFLRRTKAEVCVKEGQNTGNAPRMPTMTRKNDLICWVFLSETQEKIYRDFLMTDEVRELLSSTKSPLTALTVLKKLCDHPRLMSNRQCRQLGLLMTDEGVDLDRLDEMVEEDTAHFNVDHIEDEVLIRESGKMVFVVKLLDNLKAEGHRCLFFSQSRKILNIFQKIVKNRGHRFVRIDGTIRGLDERQKIIDTFMTDTSYTLFLLTTQVGGVGLTLTAADRVIIYDPSWNPATDSQAVDRAFRIGQDRDVVVYRLITCGSIEEKIYRRQIFKDGINKMTTGDQKNPYRYFTKQDLRELFQLSDTSVSVTQQQLEKLQQGKRKTDTRLDAHIAFLHSLDIFGISDHDLMFEIQAHSEVEGEADVDDDASEEFVKSRALKALDALKIESQTNREISEKLGNYPGPQIEEVGKLFKLIGPAVPSEAQKRNFPKPLSQFSAAELRKESRVFVPGNNSPERIDSSDEKSVDSSDEKAEGFEMRIKTLSLDKEPSDKILQPGTPPRSIAKSIKASPHASPYRVLEESLVFSPISQKPIIATVTKERDPGELYLAQHLPVDSSDVDIKPRISHKRRSSVFRRSPSPVIISDYDGDESPVMKQPTKRRAVIISDDDDDEEEDDATDLKTRQSPAEDLASEMNVSSRGDAAAKCENTDDESSESSGMKPTKHRAVTDDDDDEDAIFEARQSPAEDLTSEMDESPTEDAANEEQRVEDEEGECTDEETDDESEDEDDSSVADKFTAAIEEGKKALKRKDYESALRFFTDANAISGGNDRLKQRIYLIQKIIDKNKTQ